MIYFVFTTTNIVNQAKVHILADSLFMDSC